MGQTLRREGDALAPVGNRGNLKYLKPDVTTAIPSVNVAWSFGLRKNDHPGYFATAYQLRHTMYIFVTLGWYTAWSAAIPIWEPAETVTVVAVPGS